MKLRKRARIDELNGLLDHGTSLTGELSFSGTLRIDGNVHGSISTSDTLVIGERASIHADIKAGEVQVYGNVFGNIEGNRRIEICSTGRLQGDVRTPQFVIDEGGKFEGRSRGLEDTDPLHEEAAPEFSPNAQPFAPGSHFGAAASGKPASPAKAKKDKEWPDRFKP